MEPTPTVTLTEFRQSLHRCFTGWGDALFELTDAVLCSPTPVGSVPSLSLEPVFRRSHGSLYKAVDLGGVDEDRLRRLLVDNRPPDWPHVFAVDASTWARCDAKTSPERGFHYSASKHSNGQPIVAGWCYQWTTQLGWSPDSWTAPVDAQRLTPTTDTTTATIEQVQRLVGLLGPTADVPMFVFDAGYDPIAIGHGLTGNRTQTLTRISSKRVFHPNPDPHQGTVGRPRRHGNRFALSEPDTWTEPAATLNSHDSRHGNINVQAWPGLHPKLHGRGRWATDDNTPPIVIGTVIRVDVEHLPKPTDATPKPCGCGGPDPANLTLTCAGARTCDASTSNTPSGSSKTRSAGPPPRSGPPNKPTGGPGSPSPRTPKSVSPAPSSNTSQDHGNAPRTQQTQPRTSPKRISSTPCHDRLTSPPTEFHNTGPRPPQRDPKTPQNPPRWVPSVIARYARTARSWLPYLALGGRGQDAAPAGRTILRPSAQRKTI